MSIHPFVKKLASVELENCFNPYSDRCSMFDRFDAPRKRSRMLSKVLECACKESIDSIWIGRDLGYRGGRRTGLALTDDVNISQHLKRWGIDHEKQAITKGQIISERTARVIWDTLNCIDAHIFLWNVFPLHPYESGNHFTNRQHNIRERQVGEFFLLELIELLNPKQIIAIGNDATNVLNRLTTIPVINVRHPSYGGQSIFEKQISDLYGLPRMENGVLF